MPVTDEQRREQVAKHTKLAARAEAKLNDPNTSPEERAKAEIVFKGSMEKARALSQMFTPPKMTGGEASSLGVTDFLRELVPDPVEDLYSYVRSGGRVNPISDAVSQLDSGETTPPLEYQEQRTRELAGVPPNVEGDYVTDVIRGVANPLNLVGVSPNWRMATPSAVANLTGAATGAATPRFMEERVYPEGTPQIVKDVTNAITATVAGAGTGIGTGYGTAAAVGTIPMALRTTVGAGSAVPNALATSKIRGLIDQIRGAEGWADMDSFPAFEQKYNDLKALGKEIGYEFPVMSLAGYGEGNEAVNQFLREKSANDPAFRTAIRNELTEMLRAVEGTYKIIGGLDPDYMVNQQDLREILGNRIERIKTGAEGVYTRKLEALDKRYDALVVRLQGASGKRKEDVGRAVEDTVTRQAEVLREQASKMYEGELDAGAARGTQVEANEVATIYGAFKNLRLEDLFDDPSNPDVRVFKFLSPKEVEAAAGSGLVDPYGNPLSPTPAGGMQFDPITLRQFDSLKRLIGREYAEAKRALKRNPADPNARNVVNRLGKFNEVIRQTRESIGQRDPDFKAGYDAADAFYYEKIGLPYDSATLNDIAGAKYFSRIENLLAEPQAMREYAEFVGLDVAQPVLKDAVHSMLISKDIIKADGRVNKPLLDRFTRDNVELIEMAGLTKEFETVPTLIDETLAAKSNYTTRYKAWEKNMAKEFLKVAHKKDLPSVLSALRDDEDFRVEYRRSLNSLRANERDQVSSAVRGAFLEEAVNSGDNVFNYLKKNRSLALELFGKDHYDNLLRLGEVVKTASVIRDSVVAKAGKTSFDPMQEQWGVSFATFAGMMRNQIFSPTRKFINLTSLSAQEKGSQTYMQQGVALLSDPNIVDRLANPPSYLGELKNVGASGLKGFVSYWADVTNEFSPLLAVRDPEFVGADVMRVPNTARGRAGMLGGEAAMKAMEQQKIEEENVRRQMLQTQGMFTGGGLPK